MIRVLAHTQVKQVPIGQKKAHLMEIQVNGGSVAAKVDFAYGLLEKQVGVDSIFQPNEMIDTLAITRVSEDASAGGRLQAQQQQQQQGAAARGRRQAPHAAAAALRRLAADAPRPPPASLPPHPRRAVAPRALSHAGASAACRVRRIVVCARSRASARGTRRA